MRVSIYLSWFENMCRNGNAANCDGWDLVEECLKWITEVLDDRSTQEAFTMSLTVKALWESHTLNIVITRRIKVFVVRRYLHLNPPNSYTIKWKVHKAILSVNKLSFVSALLKWHPCFWLYTNFHRKGKFTINMYFYLTPVSISCHLSTSTNFRPVVCALNTCYLLPCVP